MFGVLIEDIRTTDLPPDLAASWQVVRLASGTDHAMFQTKLPNGREGHVTFSKAGLFSLRSGLTKIGLDARFFAWPPENDPNRTPWRGMKPLEAEDAGIFFGREAPLIEALDHLRGLADGATPRLLAILGASGAGKSSFLRAGILPRVARDDRNFVPLPILRPERAAITGETGLIAAIEGAFSLAGLKLSRARIKAAIADGARSLSSLLSELARMSQAPGLETTSRWPTPAIVISIDQCEELFHLEGRTEADTLLALLASVLAQSEPRVILLVTIRSDSYERLQTAAALEGLRQKTLSLPPMPQGAYQMIIEGPATRLKDTERSLKIEPALTAALLADLESGGGKDALPLLAFTMERLYLEHGGEGRLTLAGYRSLGGIRGSIEAAAERALKASDIDNTLPQDRTIKYALLRRAIIPWLANINLDTGLPRRRVARLTEIPEEARPLVGYLVTERLLSTERSFTPSTNSEDPSRLAPKGDVTVEPAHEALLRQWTLLQGWLNEDRAALVALEGVERAARDWNANGRKEEWLTHQRGRLEDADSFVHEERFSGFSSHLVENYLEAAHVAERARRDNEIRNAQELAQAQKLAAEREKLIASRTRVGTFIAGILAAIAIGGLVIAIGQTQEAERQADVSRLERDRAVAERDRAEFAEQIAADRNLERNIGISGATTENAIKLSSQKILSDSELVQALATVILSASSAIEVTGEINRQVVVQLSTLTSIDPKPRLTDTRINRTAAPSPDFVVSTLTDAGDTQLAVSNLLTDTTVSISLTSASVALGADRANRTALLVRDNRLESWRLAKGRLVVIDAIDLTDAPFEVNSNLKVLGSSYHIYALSAGAVWHFEHGRFKRVATASGLLVTDIAADEQGGIVATTEDGKILRGINKLEVVSDQSSIAYGTGDHPHIRYNPYLNIASLSTDHEWSNIWLPFNAPYPLVKRQTCTDFSNATLYCANMNDWMPVPSAHTPWIGVVTRDLTPMVFGAGWLMDMLMACHRLKRLTDGTEFQAAEALKRCTAIEPTIQDSISARLTNQDTTELVHRLLASATVSKAIDAAPPLSQFIVAPPDSASPRTLHGFRREFGLDGQKADDAEARQSYEVATAEGDAFAMYRLAGLIKDTDPERAATLYRRATELGSASAANAYAAFLQERQLATPLEIANHYRKAMELGDHLRAPRGLALLLVANPELLRGPNETEENLYRLAASGGNPHAAVALADLLDTDRATPTSPGEADALWKFASAYLPTAAMVVVQRLEQEQAALDVVPQFNRKSEQTKAYQEGQGILLSAAHNGWPEAFDRLAERALLEGGTTAEGDATFLSLRALQLGNSTAATRIAHILAQRGAPMESIQRWTALIEGANDAPIGSMLPFATSPPSVRQRLLASQVPDTTIRQKRDEFGRVKRAVAQNGQIEIGYDQLGRVANVHFRPNNGPIVIYSVIRDNESRVARLVANSASLSTVTYDRERIPNLIIGEAGSLVVDVLEDKLTSKGISIAIGQDKFNFTLSGGPTDLNLRPSNPVAPHREARLRALKVLESLQHDLEPLATEPLFEGLLLQPEATTFVKALLQALEE